MRKTFKDFSSEEIFLLKTILLPIKKRFTPQKNQMTIINKDILEIDETSLCQNKVTVFGNLPYNISTQIMLNLIDSFEKIEDIHFLVQKEVAQKVVGKQSTKSWGKLAIKMSSFFNTEILFDVPPEAFDIKPKVNSSFIRLIPKKDINYDLSIKNNLFKGNKK